MGDVWLARDEQLDTEVVTKIVPPDAPAEWVDLLRQECLKARRLSHPNIVRVFDFQQTPEIGFLTMEYVEGDDVGVLRGRPAREVVPALLPLVDALEYAHGQGVVHRDIKCGNVLLDGDGQPQLADFGIAALWPPDDGVPRLTGGGTPSHASPQQLAGEPPGPADDIYGLGALLYELLTGRAPNGAVEGWGSQAPHPVPTDLEHLVERMLAVDVVDRPASMSEVRTGLSAVLETSGESTLPPRTRKRDIRLSPPPKIAEVRAPTGPEPVARRAESPRTTSRPWLTLALAVVVTASLFAVFVLLPRWVEERDASRASETSIAAGETRGPEVEESEEPRAPVGVVERPTMPVEPALGVEEDALLAGTNASREEPEPQAPAGVVSSSPEQPPERRVPAKTSSPVGSGPPSTTEAFNAAMGRGLVALERSDYEGAKSAFEKALSLSPESVEAADGLAQAEAELRLVAIARHRSRGESLEQEERWAEAVSEYESVLAIDSTLRFARDGIERARTRAELDASLRYHLDHPERLAEDRVLAEAREVVMAASEIQPPTPILARQIERLQQEIERASTPVRVVLLSDNLTEVVVYRVGRLGRFERKPLELRPGTYTVVGSRSGYRDVRRQLRVTSEGEETSLTIRCEEEI